MRKDEESKYICKPSIELKIRAYHHSRAIREDSKRVSRPEKFNSPNSFYHELEGNLGNYVGSLVLCGDPSYAFTCDTVGRRDKADFIFNGWAVDCKTTVARRTMSVYKDQVERGNVDFYLALQVDYERDPNLKRLIGTFWLDEKRVIGNYLPKILSSYQLIGYLPISEVREVFEELSDTACTAFKFQDLFEELRPVSELEKIIKEKKPKAPNVMA